MLTRMKELSTQVTNGTYSTDDQTTSRGDEALGEAITDITPTPMFNGSACSRGSPLMLAPAR
jgi:flagellin-like hook-associated protein FlgL